MLKKRSPDIHSELIEQYPPMIIINQKGKIVSYNKGFKELTGLKQTGLKDRQLCDFIPEVQKIISSLNEEKNGNINFIDLQKNSFPVNFKTRKFSSGKNKFYSVSIQRNNSIKDNKSHFEELLEGVKTVFWRADAKSFVITYVNKEIENLLGYPSENWVKDPLFWNNHIHISDRDWAINYCKTETNSGRDHEFDYRMIAADGRIVWVKELVKLIIENGKPVEMIGVMIDITREKSIIEELANNKILLEEAQNLASIGSFEWNIESNLVKWSDEMFKIYGISPTNFKGSLELYLSFVHPDDREAVRKTIEKAFRRKSEFNTKERIIRPSGEIRYLQTKGKFIIDEDKKVKKLIGVCQDITENKKSEDFLKYETLLIEILKNVAIASNEAESTEEVIHFCLNEICSKTKWDLGHAFLLSHGEVDVLVPTGIWCNSASSKYNNFKAKTASLKFTSDIGFPGKVMKTKKSFWVKDIYKGKRFLRKIEAKKCGIRSSFISPILVEDSVVGALEFFSTIEHERDDKLFDVISNISTQIGRVIERKKADEKFKNLLESAPDAMVIVNFDGKISLVNAQVEKLFKYKKKELIGKAVEILIPERYKKAHPKFRELYYQSPKARGMGTGLELYGITKDGKEFPVEISLSPIETKEGILISAAIRDVTERKKSGEVIKHSEAKFRALAETANEGIVSADANGKIIYFNLGAEKIFGYTKEEVLNKNLTVLMPKKYHAAHRIGFKRFLDTGEKRIIGRTVELEGLHKSGKIIPVEFSLSSWKTAEGLFFTAMIRDITERESFVYSLRTHAKQQSAIAELGQIAIADNNLEVIFDKAVDLISKTLDVEYVKILELIPDENALLLKSGVGWKKNLVGTAKVSTGLSSQAGYTLYKENEVIVKDLRKETRFSGPALLHEHGVISGLSVPIPGSNKFYGVIGAHTKRLRNFDKNDIKFMQAIANILATSIKNIIAEGELKITNKRLQDTQKELIHSEKLAALGRFSSSIAHEIRNPLANISASAQFSLSKFSIDSKMKNHLQLILRNAENANRIIKELLDFASPRGIELEKDSIENLLNHLIELVKPRCANANIKLIKKIQPRIPKIEMSRQKLEEAFQNFISNSIDAMPDGGQIKISAFQNNSYLKIFFEDTGKGIDHSLMDNILEPFFTTKEKGTGLGLSLAHQIIKSHNGNLDIKSQTGKGTTVELSFPISKN
jgi:PAS domain S-box-containing protein